MRQESYHVSGPGKTGRAFLFVLSFMLCLVALCGPSYGQIEISNGGGALDITTNSAILRGELVSLGGDSNALVRIYWGQADGVTNEAAWATNADVGWRDAPCIFATTNTDLQAGIYYYRCWASNFTGVAWAPSTTNFTTLGLDTDNDGIPDSEDPDDDNDGMPDTWEVAYGLNPVDAADAVLDMDGDGMVNWDEYVAGTEPQDKLSVLMIEAFHASTNRSLGIIFPTVPGRLYGVDWSTNLLVPVWSAMVNDTPGTGGPVEIIDASPAAGMKFYRVKVRVLGPEVTSVNVVGYISVDLTPNEFKFVSCPFKPLHGAPPVLSNIVSSADFSAMAKVLGWNPEHQAFDTETFLANPTPHWSPGTGVYRPGTGFWIRDSALTNFYLLGEVPNAATTSVNIVEGWNALGVPYPVEDGASNLLAIGTIGKEVRMGSSTNNTGAPDTMADRYTRIAPGWDPSTPVIKPGQGFWYGAGTDAFTWNEVRPYDSPSTGSPLLPALPLIANVSPLNVTTSGAVLRGSLTWDGNLSTHVAIHWGDNDGGTNMGLWDHMAEFGVRGIGTCSTNVVGLSSDTTYYYRCYASNAFGVAWAPSTTNFMTSAGDVIRWQNSASIVDQAGNAVSTNSWWILRMYKSTDDTVINFSGGIPIGDDVWQAIEVAFQGTGTNGFFFSQVVNPVTVFGIMPGDHVYSVIFNSATYASASMYAIVDGASPLYGVTTVQACDPPWDYDTGGVVPSDWQPIGGVPPTVDNDGGASAIMSNSATLRGDLVSLGGDPNALVRIYWGQIDGVTNVGAWATNVNMGNLATGTFSTNVTGLLPGSNYFYRCWASNFTGVAWAPSTTNFTTLGGGGAIHYVSGGGSHVSPFTSWTTAATNIQAAIDSAVGGDTVLVTNGVYTGLGGVANGSNVVVITNGITLVGVEGPSTTFIDGGNTFRCVYVGNNSAIVDGFCLQNGMHYRGAGVYMYYGGTVQNCMIRNNASTEDGGGIFFDHGGMMLNSCVISNSAVSFGGGVRIEYGGGMQNCLIMGNSAGNAGGGIETCHLGFDGRTIENCTVVSNSAPTGGGIYFYQWGTVRNLIIYDNYGSSSNANFADNGSLYYDFCCTYPTPTLGTGNITNNPMFNNTATGDYTLSSLSPCINTGTNQGWMTTSTDLSDKPRLISGVVDIGAYEFGIVLNNCNGASGITPTTVTLNGNLVSLGGDSNALVRIYWGMTDGLTNAASWATNAEIGYLVTTGMFSTNVTGLLPGSSYFYRCFASNDFGEAWAPASESFFTNPNDTDGDGMPDSWEIANFGDTTAADATTDFDGDGLRDVLEYQNGTNPKEPDSDGDTFSDYVEVINNTNPTNNLSMPTYPYKEWTRIWGATTNDTGRKVVVDQLGDLYCVSRTFGSLDGQTNCGGWDFCLTKYNQSGNKLWTRIWGSAADEESGSIAVATSGCVYVFGSTYGAFDSETNAGGSDACLSKFSPDGTRLWSRVWGSATNEGGGGIAIGTGETVFVEGSTFGGFDGETNAGADDVFISMFDSDGNRQWSRIWGSSASDYGGGLVFDGNTNLYASLNTFGFFDGETNRGVWDFALSKWTTDGTCLWSRIWGSSVEDWMGEAVGVGDVGNIYVLGYTHGSFDGQTNSGNGDACLTKFDPSGVKLWTRIWGSVTNDHALGLSIGTDYSIYCCGIAQESFDGQTFLGVEDAFLAKFAPDGNRLWTRQWGSAQMDCGTGIFADQGNVFVSGHTSGAFDGQTNAGSEDVFLTKWIDVLPLTVKNLDAINITTNSATLRGGLLSTGPVTNTADIGIFWGPADGGTNELAWSNSVFVGTLGPGPFSTNTANLSPNTEYYYRCFASNVSGVAWAQGTASFTTLNPDADADGILDDWEIIYFGDTNATAGADPDGDGASNLHEYFAGTIPTNANSVFDIVNASVVAGCPCVCWSSVTDRLYTVERTTNLVDAWLVVTNHIAGTGNPICCQDTVMPTGGSRFYRIAVEDSGTNEVMTLHNAIFHWLDTAVSGSGSVDVADGWCMNDAAVLVTATADANNHFVQWIGDTSGCASTGNQIVAVMDQPRTITANFEIDIYGITVTTGPGGAIAPSGVVQVSHGGDTNFVVQASTNRHIAEVLVDGESAGIFGPGSNTFVYGFVNVVTNHAIHAAFNGAPTVGLVATPTQGVAPLRVTFDVSGSIDPDGNLSHTAIDRGGDGIYETVADGAGKVITEYASPGVYTSSVKVVDAYGLFDAASVVVEVWGAAPTAVLDANPTNGNAPLSVTFWGTNSQAAVGRQIVLYEWDFDGDGTVDRISQAASAVHTYGSAGNYQAMLRITDNQGLQDSDEAWISVAPPILIAPTVSLEASPSVGRIPLDVTLTATASDTDGTVVEYAWDFDGNGEADLVGTTNIVIRSYTLPGAYMMSVRVKDNDGLTATAAAALQVTEDAQVKVWISKPSDGAHLWGDAVSLMGHVAPANATSNMQFQYKLGTVTNWTDLGAPLYPQPSAYKTTWDVTSLINGADYHLRAVATLEGGEMVASPVYTMRVDSNAGNVLGGVVEWASGSGGKHEKNEKLDKNATTTCDTFDGTSVTVPAGALDTNTVIQVVLIGENTNAVNGSADGQSNIGANRTVTLAGDPTLSMPITIIVPYDDVDDNGIVDGAGVPETTLTAHWYDPVAGMWKRALSSEVNVSDNYVKMTTHHLTEFGVFGDLNLLHPANGGVLMSFTSQLTNSTAAANLTDGNTVSYWQSAAPPGGSQEFIYCFTNYQGAILSEAVVRNYGQFDQGFTNYSKNFAVYLAMVDTNFVCVTNGVLQELESPQVFPINCVTCRYVKLVISTGVNPDAWELAEFAVHGSLTKDPDADGMDDAWEMKYFGNFDRGGNGDYEPDGLTDRQEFDYGSNPTTNDTDGDMMTDGWEVEHGLMVTTNDAALDADGDGMCNLDEFIAGTNPTNDVSRFGMLAPVPDGPFMTNVWLETNDVWCTSVVMQAEQMIFCWDTVSGRTYRLYSATNLLASEGWSCWFGPVSGDGTGKSATNSITNDVRKFYRIGVSLP